MELSIGAIIVGVIVIIVLAFGHHLLMIRICENKSANVVEQQAVAAIVEGEPTAPSSAPPTVSSDGTTPATFAVHRAFHNMYTRSAPTNQVSRTRVHTMFDTR